MGGAIVIPPRNSKPYMFSRDVQCQQEPKRMRRKGEWFVRRGASNEPGLPEDLAIITQKQFELTVEPLRETVRNLQSRVSKVEEQYNSALFKLVKRVSGASSKTKKIEPDKNDEISSDLSVSLGLDLPTRLKQKLRTPTDEVVEELIEQAKSIKDFIDGSNIGLPWTPQPNNPEVNKKIIEDLEEKTRIFQVSLATIILNDHKAEYTPALLRSIKILAVTIEAPSGTQYNRIGEALRYYPLGLILYTVFVCGVAANRGLILREVLKIPLKHRRKNTNSYITDIFFNWYEAKPLFNNAFGQRWCEPMVQRIRQLINDRIGGMITEFSESEYFFRGEFVLSLANIDKDKNLGEEDSRALPSGGLYLYYNEAYDPIVGFLLENPKWFGELFKHPLGKVLSIFDQNAHKMADSGCSAIGLHGLKTLEKYQESLLKE